MTRPSISVVLFSAWLLITGIGITVAEDQNQFLQKRIPALKVKDASLDEVVELLIAASREIGADQAGFKGVIATANPTWDKRISFDFKDVPIAFVLKWVALAFSADVAERDGIVVIFDREQALPTMVYLTPNLLKGLGLKKAPTEEELRDGKGNKEVWNTYGDILLAPIDRSVILGAWSFESFLPGKVTNDKKLHLRFSKWLNLSLCDSEDNWLGMDLLDYFLHNFRQSPLCKMHVFNNDRAAVFCCPQQVGLRERRRSVGGLLGEQSFDHADEALLFAARQLPAGGEIRAPSGGRDAPIFPTICRLFSSKRIIRADLSAVDSGVVTPVNLADNFDSVWSLRLGPPVLPAIPDSHP